MTVATIDITASYVRTLGNLPAFLPDEELLPHMESAKRHVTSLLAGSVPTSPDDVERVKEATGCFAIAFALPGLNTFCLAHADQVPRLVAETDYVFNDAGDVKTLVGLWESRGAKALRDVGRRTGAVSATTV
ncbi:MAG: hypothetical protein Q4F74_02800 [Synergistaceae bacterium]|nr:hypothetical protein [Synergistaceae bacterium]